MHSEMEVGDGTSFQEWTLGVLAPCCVLSSIVLLITISISLSISDALFQLAISLFISFLSFG